MDYNPVNALLYFFLTLAGFALIFWPDKGIWFRIKKSLQNNQRVMMEDALKYIYDCERVGNRASIKSIAGTLAVNSDQVTGIVNRLRELNLIELSDSGFTLTASGREYALRIIRIHRLWEQYLAERTGMPETAWHVEADILEHKVSDEQADEMNRILGYPRYDPHGDPIPTKSGDLPPEKGQTLNTLNEGVPAEVIHVEDEPRSIYSEIIDSNIHPGTIIRIDERKEEDLELNVEGSKTEISKLAAENITVRSQAEIKEMDHPAENLTDLDISEQAEVIGISKACRGLQRRRLMDLGIVPGTIITTEMKSLGGDPTAFTIRGAQIALRKSTAELVQVKRIRKVA
jgi:DtxR family Mn-dependent transcriptional regulator